MSLNLDRINYVLNKSLNYTKNVSISQASKDSGIPYTTLYYFVKGGRTLPDKYNTNLKSLYTTNVYYNLRETGLNSIQSNRFRYSNPEKVSNMTEQIYAALDYYATGTAITKASKLDYMPSKEEWKYFYDKAFESQKKGLNTSKQSVEDWVEYGSP
ncbi:MAG: helix-turn-helix domain-containing protein [Sulfurovaceae bacterium]|nr:helix-turn-helix domain-containing protein [Sulfurovaceae bacterium]